MSLRDPEFQESLEGFIATSTLEKDPLLPPEKVCIRYLQLSLLLLITIVGRGYEWASCSKTSLNA
jgi:hypothetical protein